KSADVDARKASCTRDAGVEGKVLAVGEEVGIVGNQTKVNVSEAKAKIVQHAGAGGPNPVRADRIRAYRIPVLPVAGCDGMIFPIAEVVADVHHAIEGVLRVDPIVDFSYSVVAGIGIRETAIVRCRVRRGVLDQAARARVRWRRSAAQQFQADGTWRYAARLEHIESIHHAFSRIPAEGAGRGYQHAKRIADQGTQPLVIAKEEQSVFHDRPAQGPAELFQFRGLFRAGGIEEVAGRPSIAAAKCVSRAVKRVGPRPDSDVHYGARHPTVLRFGILFKF